MLEHTPKLGVRPLFGSNNVTNLLSDAMDVEFAFFRTNSFPAAVVAKHILNQGDTVFDIGANLGSESLAFSNLVGKSGRVIELEPQELCFNVLKNRIA